MDTTIYFKRGDLSSAVGLTIDKLVYDDDYFGKPDVLGQEITREEYLELLEYVNNPNKKYGHSGVVNDEGYAKYLQDLAESGE